MPLNMTVPDELPAHGCKSAGIPDEIVCGIFLTIFNNELVQSCTLMAHKLTICSLSLMRNFFELFGNVIEIVVILLISKVISDS